MLFVFPPPDPLQRGKPLRTCLLFPPLAGVRGRSSSFYFLSFFCPPPKGETALYLVYSFPRQRGLGGGVLLSIYFLYFDSLQRGNPLHILFTFPLLVGLGGEVILFIYFLLSDALQGANYFVF